MKSVNHSSLTEDELRILLGIVELSHPKTIAAAYSMLTLESDVSEEGSLDDSHENDISPSGQERDDHGNARERPFDPIRAASSETTTKKSPVQASKSNGSLKLYLGIMIPVLIGAIAFVILSSGKCPQTSALPAGLPTGPYLKTCGGCSVERGSAGAKTLDCKQCLYFTNSFRESTIRIDGTTGKICNRDGVLVYC